MTQAARGRPGVVVRCAALFAFVFTPGFMSCRGMRVAGSSACAASSTTSTSNRGAAPDGKAFRRSPPLALSVHSCSNEQGRTRRTAYHLINSEDCGGYTEEEHEHL